MMDCLHPLTLQQRRLFLQQCAGGLGGTALIHMLQSESQANIPNELTHALQPKMAHFAPKAKNVIFLFMAGAPSQLDLFDPKPKMRELHGQPLPESFLTDLDDALLKGSAQVFSSPRSFTRHGQCGMDFSDYLPHLAQRADALCMIRTMFTDVSNHHPAQLLMNCGIPRFGAPSMGAWVTYGLGNPSHNLPGFVVMLSNSTGTGDLGGTALWDNAFLPPIYRGVTFRSTGEPILFLSNPRGSNSTTQRARLSAIRDLNQLRHRVTEDPEINARVSAYELAFRMQSAAPELIDFSDETEHTLNSYGVNDETTRWFGSNCLLARRMVERGVRFVQLYHYTWDDHADLNKNLKRNCSMTDQPAAALIQDLKQRGLLEDTLVVWGGEFGRTPMHEVRRTNAAGREGRDHHPFSFTMLLAGAGIKTGQIIGQTDELGYHGIEDKVHVHDLQATLLHLLGLDHTQLTYRFQGRDFRLTDIGGKIVPNILA